MPEPVNIRLIEFEGEAAIEFDDGDIIRQAESIGTFLMHLSILMPNCDLPNELEIRGKNG